MERLCGMDPLLPDDPDQVGGYRLLGRLGGGGMGQVFLGRSAGGRPVAVKMVRPEFGADPGFRRRFKIEVEAARRVGGFYTAQVVDADPDAERPWLVTAYVPGPSLAAAVKAHGPLPVPAVRVLGAGLAEGLAAVHACGLVHRDLKPANVILAPDGPRVIDFGIARALESAPVTATGATTGTPAFMSPEQARGASGIGPASDVFSLGAVLAYAAAGHPPFGTGPAPALLYRIVGEEPDLAAVPAPLRDLVAGCLAKDPADRPGVAEVLSRCAAGGPEPGGGWLPGEVAAMAATAADLDAAPAPAAPMGRPAPRESAGRAGRGWLLPGASALALLVLLAAGVAAALVLDGQGGKAASKSPAAASAGGTPSSPAGGASSQVVGRIDDPEAGLSYARLGRPWVAAPANWLGDGGFTAGQIAPVQEPVNGASFNATSLSRPALPDESEGYPAAVEPRTVADRVEARMLREMFTVQHSITALPSGRRRTADGREAWLRKIRLDFPQARANGWRVSSAVLAILVVHRGAGEEPGVLMVSLPDAFTAQGDLEAVLGSVRTL